MRARLPFILLLVSVMVALTTLAYVETPDQVWLGGFYDEDADDALVYVQTHFQRGRAAHSGGCARLSPVSSRTRRAPRRRGPRVDPLREASPRSSRPVACSIPRST
jgi:hypothetical protein